MANSAICAIDGCDKNVFRKIWCSAHYGRWKRNGDPLAGRTPPGEPLEYFNHVVTTWQSNDCLVWPYALDSKGYGRLWISGKIHPVNRLALIAQKGEPSDPKLEAAHSCGNRSCVNHKHLRWATTIENAADRVIQGTHNRGARNTGCKLKPGDVLAIRRARGTHSTSQLAKRYGVSPTTVSRIWLRKKWAWLG